MGVDECVCVGECGSCYLQKQNFTLQILYIKQDILKNNKQKKLANKQIDRRECVKWTGEEELDSNNKNHS